MDPCSEISGWKDTLRSAIRSSIMVHPEKSGRMLGERFKFEKT